MAAGDIIFEDGTILTPADLEKLIPFLQEKLSSTAKDPGQYPVMDRLEGVTSIPCFNASYDLVRVLIAQLKGNAGATPDITFNVTSLPYGSTPSVQKTGTAENPVVSIGLPAAKNGEKIVWRKTATGIEVKYEGEPDISYKTLFTFAEVMPDVSDFSKEGITLLQRPATEAATEVRQTMTTIQSEADAAIQSATEAAEAAQTAAGNVQDGKTPVITIGTVEGGSSAAATMTSAGTDESGNPKSALNLVLPKGNTGPAPILELGEVTTVEPSDPASATFRPNGVDPSGANKYRLALSIPKGKSGQDGTGAGNVLVNNEASLLASKQYAFKPGQDGSVNGTFEEVVASDSKITLDLDGLGESGNGIFGSELNNYLNKLEIVQKSITAGTPYQKFKQVIIDNALPIVGKYTLDNKVRFATCSNLVIDNFSITMFKETVYITDGIKLEFNYESIKNTILFANVDNEEGALSFTSSDGLNMIYLHPKVISLTSLSTSDEIFSSCGGKEILATTCKNLTLGMQLAIGINGMQYYLPYMVTPAYRDDDDFSLYFFLNFNNLEMRLSIAVSAGQASCEVDYLSFAYSDNRDEDGLYVNKITGGKIIQSKLSTALAELGETGSFEIPSALLELTNESTSDEIKAAVGGDVGFTTFLKAVLGDCKLYIDEPNDFIREAKFRRFCDVYGAHEAIDKDDFSAIGFYIQPYEDTQYFIMVGRTYDSSEYMFNIEQVRGSLVSVTPDSHQVYFKYDQYRDKLIFDHSSSGSTDDNTSYVAFSLGDAIKLLRDGDGSKALMDDGTYHKLTEVLDNLLSTNTTAALSANQGRILNERIDKKVGSEEITTIKKLTQAAYDALSSKDGKTLYACIQSNGTIVIR